MAKDRLSVLNTFYAAPLDALFKESQICEIFDFSQSNMQLLRKKKISPPYIKIGGTIFYRKGNVMEFIDEHQVN